MIAANLPTPSVNALTITHHRLLSRCRLRPLSNTMIAPALALLQSLSVELTPQEALSGIFGSISLATWVFLLVC